MVPYERRYDRPQHRLEEFLREERVAGEQTKIILEWRDASNPSEDRDKESGEPQTEGQ